MAALEPDATPRLFLTYTVGGEDHVQQVRYPPSGSQSAAISTLVEMWAFLDSALYLCTINKLEYSNTGSSVRIPLAWPGNADYGAGAPPAGQEMKFFSVVGKDTLGRRVRLEQFGITQAIPTTWRLALGINAAMDDWFDHVQQAYLDVTLVTIADNPAFFNQYYNFKYADNDIAKVRL